MSPETVRVVAASLEQEINARIKGVVSKLSETYGFDKEDAKKYLNHENIDLKECAQSHDIRMAEMTNKASKKGVMSFPNEVLRKTENNGKSQSEGLADRQKKYHENGKHLCQDSNISESTLKTSMEKIKQYAKKEIEKYGGKYSFVNKVTLYEAQVAYHKAGGPSPDIENDKYFMKPDAGIIFAQFGDEKYVIFCGEDKIQGTNDIRYCDNLNKQSCGNAIERFAKNVRACELLTSNMSVFPYIIFASGCDFHHTETISKRFEMGNYGKTNYYINISNEATKEDINTKLEDIIKNISIDNWKGNKCCSSIFVKAHKYDEMPNGSSLWSVEERIKISKHVIDLTLNHIQEKL